MTDNEKIVLQEFLSKTLKLDGEAFGSLFNAEGELVTLKPAIEADAARMQKNKDKADLEYNKGLAKAMSRLEIALREKYEVEDEELKGAGLVEAIIEKQRTTAAEKAQGDVDVEAHPKYIKLRNSLEKKLKDAKTEYDAELVKISQKQERESVLAKVRQAAEAELEELCPILPDDPKKAKEWKNIYLQRLEAFDYTVTEDGEFVPKKEGKLVEDEHGNIIGFKDLSKRTAEALFTFKAASERSSASNSDSSQDPTVRFIFKDRADYIAKLKIAKDDAERNKMIVDWKTANPNG